MTSFERILAAVLMIIGLLVLLKLKHWLFGDSKPVDVRHIFESSREHPEIQEIGEPWPVIESHIVREYNGIFLIIRNTGTHPARNIRVICSGPMNAVLEEAAGVGAGLLPPDASIKYRLVPATQVPSMTRITTVWDDDRGENQLYELEATL